MRRSLAARGVRRATWLVAVLALQPLFDVAVASDYALDFSKNLNVWAWDHALGWNHTFGSGLALSADATHARKVSDIAFGLSRESRTTGGNAALDYAISPTLSVGGTFELFHSRLRSGGAPG